MDFKELKEQLEKDLLITEWEPNELQLSKISKKISLLNEPIKKSDIARIIFEEYGSYECISMEGIDNSDLRTLLKLASNDSNKND